ncbi:MAG: hypothetical protein L0Z50_29420 [Verrucomicrobiales bacterium]|nr:hypothetical protein [Verrucomicrobiales bacterium]
MKSKKQEAIQPERKTAPPPESGIYVRRHMRFGWWSILVFLTLGVVLESLHGLKVAWYLDVSNSTRRLMWTLGHAHGTLLGLIQLAFGVTVQLLPDWNPKPRDAASICLMIAGILLPGGFLLGGIVVHGGDPGLGILLVPIGALALFLAVFLTARQASRSKS